MDLFDELDQSLSIYKKGTLINRFNESTEGLVIDHHMKAVVEKVAGGELKITIPVIGSLGASAELASKDLQTIQLTLVPARSTTRTATRTEAFEKDLVKAIKAIQEGIKNASEGEPKFTLKDASVELNFVVNAKGEISLLAKGSGQSEFAQTVKLSLVSA